MDVALLLVGLAVGVLVVTEVAERWELPAPLLLIAVGIAASFVPLVPQVQLGPDVVLLGLLPPLLYAAAIQTSLVDFNANRRPILVLSIGLVVFTTFGVGWVVHAMLPGASWATALMIGAVVAPPDAVAATAIARRIGLPRRVVTILEGESLLNDATALVALRTAIAAGAGTVHLWQVGLGFLVAAGGGVLVGLATVVVVGKIRLLIGEQPVLDTAISLVVPFAAYLSAELVHGSGVIAVVVAGLLLGHKAPVLQTARGRIAERTNWRTIAFLLENAVFLLIGLQARSIVAAAQRSSVGTDRIVAVCAATLVAVIVLRIVWMFPARFLLMRPQAETGKRDAPLDATFLISWAGMRGVVTLAAAFVIPAGTEDREVLLLIAFTVVAGTLFLQTPSLRWIARLLRVPSPDPRQDALARANLLQQAGAAGLAAIDALDDPDPHGVRDVIRDRLEQRSYAAWERLGPQEGETPSQTYARMRQVMIDAERTLVLRARSTGQYPHEVVQDVLATLDVEESMLEHGSTRRQELRTSLAEPGYQGNGDCAHLRAADPRVGPRTPGECEDCVREGTTWVHLRTCLTCGHVGCCDSSPRRHATAHYADTRHPVIRSAERGESWRWCFVDEVTG
ncbi:MAG TPA: cation:proton antiporter [Marmoricola sp.]|nr:cation:proton antiporter [Marmoricola sp.]